MSQDWEFWINPYIFSQIPLNKGTRQFNGGKNSLFNKQYWNNLILIFEPVNSNSYLTAYTKINSKCITYLSVRVQSIKLLEKKIGVNLGDYELGKPSLVRTPRHGTMNVIKIENLYTSKWYHQKVCTIRQKSVSKDVEKLKPSHSFGRNAKWCSHFRKQSDSLQNVRSNLMTQQFHY